MTSAHVSRRSADGPISIIDTDGCVFILGRTDDVIDVAGHHLSTGALEAELAQHLPVGECAVIDVADGLEGQVPMGPVVLVAVEDPSVLGEIAASLAGAEHLRGQEWTRGRA